MISDMHQYLYGKKVALVGDPDQLIAMTEFLVSLDMKPIHIVTGTPGKKFEKRIKELTKDMGLRRSTSRPRAICSCSTSGSRTSRSI